MAVVVVFVLVAVIGAVRDICYMAYTLSLTIFVSVCLLCDLSNDAQLKLNQEDHLNVHTITIFFTPLLLIS